MSMEFAAWNSLYSVMTAQQDRRPFSWATVRRILAFARPRRAMLAGFLALSVVGAILAVATPLLAGRVVDALVNQQPFAIVWSARPADRGDRRGRGRGRAAGALAVRPDR